MEKHLIKVHGDDFVLLAEERLSDEELSFSPRLPFLRFMRTLAGGIEAECYDGRSLACTSYPEYLIALLAYLYESGERSFLSCDIRVNGRQIIPYLDRAEEGVFGVKVEDCRFLGRGRQVFYDKCYVDYSDVLVGDRVRLVECSDLSFFSDNALRSLLIPRGASGVKHCAVFSTVDSAMTNIIPHGYLSSVAEIGVCLVMTERGQYERNREYQLADSYITLTDDGGAIYYTDAYRVGTLK